MPHIVTFLDLSHEAHSIEVSSHTYIHTRFSKEHFNSKQAVRYTYCALFITKQVYFTSPMNHALPNLKYVAQRGKAAITVILRFDADHLDYFEWLRVDGFQEFLTVGLHGLRRPSCKLVD